MDADQKRAIELIKQGLNAFITGAAGTGKSFVLRKAIQTLKQVHGEANVAICGPTWLSALAIEGVTIHKFAGIGALKKEMSNEQVCRQVCGDVRAMRRWRRCKALVIDEVSQVDAHLLQLLQFLARKTRPAHLKNLPFSGIQLVFAGDFAQLRPVGSSPRYAFESACWEEIFKCNNTIVLQHVHRVSSCEALFLTYLDELRKGQPSLNATTWFQSRCKKPPEGEFCVTICGTNKQASMVNKQALQRLLTDRGEEDPKVFVAQDTLPQDQLVKLTRIPKRLELAAGAKVLLLTTIDPSLGLVNGARGVVQRFETVEGELVPFVKFFPGTHRERTVPVFPSTQSFSYPNGEELGQFTQIPLCLAYALTIHKAQGMEFERVLVDMSNIFEFGQAYTAISRTRSSRGLFLTAFRPESFLTHPQVAEFLKSIAPSPSTCQSNQTLTSPARAFVDLTDENENVNDNEVEIRERKRCRIELLKEESYKDYSKISCVPETPPP